MCGRFVSPHEKALERYINDQQLDWVNDLENFDLRPTQTAPILIEGASGWAAQPMHWGLLPQWAKDKKLAYKTFNARGETVAEKPSFRTAFKTNRCIVPVVGFYEWSGEKGHKVRHYIHRTDGELLLLAGLWASNTKVEAKPVNSFTIVTTPPNSFMATIHNRMPVILEPGAAGEWMMGDTKLASAHIRACPNEWLSARRVANNVGNEKKQLEAI